MTATPQPIEIYVDADACPVKPEIYRVAERHRVKVFVVANASSTCRAILCRARAGGRGFRRGR